MNLKIINNKKCSKIETLVRKSEWVYILKKAIDDLLELEGGSVLRKIHELS